MAFVVTAVATAVELGTVAAIATAVSEVGIAMSVVGAITGNKELIKIGGILGIAGGVASIGASLATSAAGAATDAVVSTAGDAALDSASQEAIDAFGGQAADQAAQQAGISSMENAGSDLATSGLTDASGLSTAAPATDALSTATPVTSSAPTFESSLSTTPPSTTSSALPGPTDVTGAQGPAGVQDLTGAQAPTTPYDAGTGSGSAPSGDVALRRAMGGVEVPGSTTGSGSLFDQFQSWVKQNPKFAELGLQTVGGALKGMSDQNIWDRRLNLQQQQINQTSYGNTIGTYGPRVSANPGLITGAMK